MKYKNLTKEQIIISLDRLTRFKNTREKYLRVYIDVLISCLLEPRLKKSEIEKMDFAIITEYVSKILNTSVNYLLQEQRNNQQISNKYIKEFLCDYENSIFICNTETQKLLNNNIDYVNALSLIDEDSPVNLKWLRELAVMLNSFQHPSNLDFYMISKQVRNEKLLKFPVEKVILVEGITEEILLPAFSRFLGYDFYAHGIQIIPAGGKNQVVKMYYKLAQELKLPIFVLLDKDAEDNINQIKPRLRNIDKIHLVSCGEFEDLLPKTLIVKTVNEHFKNFLRITEEDLIRDLPTAKVLEELFKTKGLHEFKKAEFAKLVRENINNEQDISDEIRQVVDEIRI